jgi:E3 ubiquitin-protein ligase UBR7
VIELFAKRNFRCDCGNDKFQQGIRRSYFMTRVECALEPKDGTNQANRYNHNFRGRCDSQCMYLLKRYCLCDSTYDPETEESVMHQCVVCEDWFHERCVGAGKIRDDEALTGAFLCAPCIGQHPWLLFYEKETLEEEASDPQTPGKRAIDKMNANEPAQKKQRVDVVDTLLRAESSDPNEHGSECKIRDRDSIAKLTPKHTCFDCDFKQVCCRCKSVSGSFASI